VLNKLKILGFADILRVCAFLVRSSLIWFPKVAQILPKVAPNPWGFGLGLMGALPIGPIGPYKGPIRALIGPY